MKSCDAPAVKGRLPCPEWIIAFLEYIESELDRVMWNRNQEEYESPFRNTGNAYKNDVFAFYAHNWDADLEGTFYWRHFVVRWYKNLGRGTWINQDISPETGIQMLNECLAAVREEELAL